MNSKNILSLYVFSLIGGIMLIVLNGRAALFEGIVTVAGVLFLAPCCWMLFQTIITLTGHKRKQSADNGKQRMPNCKTSKKMSMLQLIPISGGICFGALLISIPEFFVHYLIYTFGIVMFLCGLAQLIFTIPGMKWMNLSRWWLTSPIVMILIGIMVLVLKAEKVESFITLLTGIALTVYSVAGFVCWLYRQSRLRQMDVLSRE